MWPVVRAALARAVDDARPPGSSADPRLLATARLAAAMAAFEGSVGEHDEAIRWAGVAAASSLAYEGPVEAHTWCAFGPSERDAFPLLPAEVLLRAGRVDEALAALDRAGVGSTEQADLVRTLARAHRAAADEGDGAEVARLLQQRTGNARALRVAAFTTRSAGDRAALSAWARFGVDDGCRECTADRFHALTARLAIAEGVGDAALVAEVAPVAKAYRAALLRREIAVPLLALDYLESELRGGAK
jgi:hypothetical protein